MANEMVCLNLKRFSKFTLNASCFIFRKEKTSEEKTKLRTEIQRETEKLKEISLTVA